MTGSLVRSSLLPDIYDEMPISSSHEVQIWSIELLTERLITVPKKSVVFDNPESNAVSKIAPFFGIVNFTHLVFQTILRMNTEWY